MAEDGAPADFLVNQQIKDFCFDLHDATRRSHLAEDIERLYSTEWKELSEKYCDKSPWPSAEAVASQCIGDDGQPDQFFLHIYKEMALRQLFANGHMKPTLEDRIEAWKVYGELLTALESTDEASSLVLTAQWVFDIMHEFVYQFQSFCQYRTANSGRSDAEKATLEANRGAWSASAVFTHLDRLVVVSKLRTEKGVPTGPPPSELHRQLGYFAVVTMSRLECLLGDYESAVALLQVDGIVRPFDELALGSRVFACRLTVVYHLGFALLMLKRYRDAICTLNSMLSYLARIAKSGGFARFNAADQVQKNHDRMLALLAVALALAPGVALVDDAVLANLKDKYAEKVALMARGDVAAFHGMLQFASPKSVVPAVPDYASADSTSTHDAYRQQLDLFSQEIAHQQRLAKIRSYLKLYTSIGIEKLARFNDVSPEEFRAQLVGIKQKMRAMAQPVEPFFQPVAPTGAQQDLHFYVKGEMLHVDEAPTELRHDDFFANEIVKFDHVLTTLSLANTSAKK